jgi:hypothetical protein
MIEGQQEEIEMLTETASLETLIGSVLAHPDFRGVVVWDPAHRLGQVITAEEVTTFCWRSMHCVARQVCSGLAHNMPEDQPTAPTSDTTAS